MSKSQKDEESPKPEFAPKVEAAAGGGSGGSARTAIGMFDSNPAFDPALLTDRPPFWFHYKKRKVGKHFHKCFSKMPAERAFKIMQNCGFPPLCILTLATNWNLLGREKFDHLDLQAVFETAGYEVSDFGKIVTEVESRCVYRLDKVFGTNTEAMLANADVDELVYEQ